MIGMTQQVPIINTFLSVACSLVDKEEDLMQIKEALLASTVWGLTIVSMAFFFMLALSDPL